MTGYEQVRVLLVEDDDGDALLASELLDEAGADVTLQRARSLAEAERLVDGVACVLLDLGLPDSQGLNGLGRLLAMGHEAAIVVLTGIADEHLGRQAVRAGAQDYLVKGEVAGDMLHRVIRYAIERRHAEEAQRQLAVARLRAEENTRLERGLLPSPLLADPRLAVSARCVPGGQGLLGGDFYDVVEAADGWVHALIGDVCGHGPAEAALGVCLRVAWRTLVLAGLPAAEILSIVQEVLEHERHDDTMYATLCMLSVEPGRTSGWVRLAGHPPPLLVTRTGIQELDAPASPPPGLGGKREDWPGTQVKLGDSWSVLLYTDGLIEGRIGDGSERLGSEGLIDLVTRALDPGDPAAGPVDDDMLLDRLVEQVRDLNGGDLEDDVAVLALGCAPPGES